jgi:hypothetical protein
MTYQPTNKPPRLSDEELAKRWPSYPVEVLLAGALQDSVHREIGKSRPVKAVRVAKAKRP